MSLEFYLEYDKIIKQLEELENNNDNDYTNLFNLVNNVLLKEKIKYTIDTTYCYEYELFIHLCVCQNIFGALSTDNKLIFIDEFQDYSYIELSVLKQVFPNGVFNYYGDFKQCINVKGTTKQEDLKDLIMGCTTYKISENYRNAAEITLYTNKKLLLNMMPIGIVGEVSESSLSIDVFNITNDDDRIACIVKDLSTCPMELTKSPLFNVVDDTIEELPRGIINIIPVALVKGLEFENVYVLTNGMSENEQYVSYTRALNKLHVLS